MGLFGLGGGIVQMSTLRVLYITLMLNGNRQSVNECMNED